MGRRGGMMGGEGMHPGRGMHHRGGGMGGQDARPGMAMGSGMGMDGHDCMMMSGGGNHRGMGMGMMEMGPGMGMGPRMAMGPSMMGMGPGMNRGPGRGAEMHLGRDMLAGLGLSDDQFSRVRKIHDDLRRRNWDNLGKLMDERARLRDLYGAPTFDRNAIGSVYRRMGELRQQMTEARLDAHATVEELLTPDQRDRLRSRWRQFERLPAE